GDAGQGEHGTAERQAAYPAAQQRCCDHGPSWVSRSSVGPRSVLVRSGSDQRPSPCGRVHRPIGPSVRRDAETPRPRGSFGRSGRQLERISSRGPPYDPWRGCQCRRGPLLWHSQPESANECQGGPFHMPKLQPLDDRIVVRPGESEETTASGLVIPDTAKEKPQQGEVIAVGPGRRSEDTGEVIPMDVAKGDTVVYSKYGGTEITVEGEDLLILSSRDVLAKLA